MRRWIVTSILLWIVPMMVASQVVDREELRTTADTSVEFVNYEGPHDVIETREQIMGIGRALAEVVTDPDRVVASGGKYRAIHAVDRAEEELLEADIIYLLEGSLVDHIRNVRLILSGFFMEAYQYNRDDAAVLAEYVTIYNAVYRKRISYFEENYKSIVLDNLDEDAVGIATAYTEWPGRTQMVIPLTDRAAGGGLGSLDTDELSEDEVVEEMRQQEDRGVPSRKDMTELREREVEEEQARIDEQREEVEEEQQRIEERRQAIEEEREQVAEERQEAEEAGDEERAAAARERDQQIEEEQDELRQQEEEVAEREEELDRREDGQEERVASIQEERERIAEDERELLEEEESPEPETATAAASAAEPERTILFLEMVDAGDSKLGRLALINPDTQSYRARSQINSIRGKQYGRIGSSIIVIAGRSMGTGAIRLLLLDPDSLVMTGQSEQRIYEGSLLHVEDDRAYAIAEADDGWVLGRFDENLNMIRSSSVNVDPDTTLRIDGELIYVQDEEGGIVGLSMSSLSPEQRIER